MAKIVAFQQQTLQFVPVSGRNTAMQELLLPQSR
jgi:hypothetical protein